MSASETRRTKADYSGGCEVCGTRWYAANTVGVAARHTQAHGHRTWVDVSYVITFYPS